MSGKTKKILIGIISGVTLVLVFLGGYFTYYFTMNSEMRLVKEVIDRINGSYYKLYYDPSTGEYLKVDFTADDYATAIVDGLLDDYSEYYSVEEYYEETRKSGGNYYGTGMTFLTHNNMPTVFQVKGNSPAKKAGIKPGMTITAISLTQDGALEDVTDYAHFNLLYAEIPEMREFKVRMSGGEMFTLSKEDYRVSYVEYKDSDDAYYFESEKNGETPRGVEYPGEGLSQLSGDTAYIKLDEFEGNAAEQFAEAVKRAQSKGKTKLVLDLRNNLGGNMEILVQIASYLVNDGGKDKTLVCSAHFKDGSVSAYNALRNNYVPFQKVTALANEYSASASECLLGAMLSYNVINADSLVIEKDADGRAKTYGKGIMQTTYHSGVTGYALKLTTAYIFWPDGTTNIHGRGISASGLNAVEVSASCDSALQRAADILSGQ